MRGMPRDFDELVQLYGSTLQALAPKSYLLVAHHLWYRDLLSQYRPPATMTRDQVVAYLGISESTWLLACRRRPQSLPTPIEGTRLSKAGTYRTPEVSRCFEQRDRLFPRISKRGFYVSALPGFEDFLVVETKKLLEEIEAEGYIFDLPPDLPQNDTALMKLYSTTVARVVRFRLKYGMNVEDAIDEVWLKLFETRVLVKFMRSGPKRLPAHLTTEEALDYLGLEWHHWQRMLRVYPQAPNPVKGSAYCLDALYRSEDIRALDESGFFKKRGLRYLPASSISATVLERYIARSAENTLMNIFRTLDRRFNKEDTLQDGACIQDNRRVRMLRREDPDLSWEETLRSDDISVEALLDIKRRVIQEQVQVFG